MLMNKSPIAFFFPFSHDQTAANSPFPSRPSNDGTCEWYSNKSSVVSIFMPGRDGGNGPSFLGKFPTENINSPKPLSHRFGADLFPTYGGKKQNSKPPTRYIMQSDVFFVVFPEPKNNKQFVNVYLDGNLRAHPRQIASGRCWNMGTQRGNMVTYWGYVEHHGIIVYNCGKWSATIWWFGCVW